MAGCAQAPPPQQNTTPLTCEEYCVTLPHVQCAGSWRISGQYPGCVCNYECKNNTNITPLPPPSPPPPENNTNTPNLTCQEYCPTQPHVQCVGIWNISGTYPNCTCSFNCNVDPPEENKSVEIQVTARQWSFDPNTITVKKGDKVKLIITSQDVTHSFSLPGYNINVQLSSGTPMIVEFTADKVGEFPFRCSVFCGSGHSSMAGTLIVEE